MFQCQEKIRPRYFTHQINHSFQVEAITSQADQSDSDNIKARGDKLADRYEKIKKLADETAAKLDENAQGKRVY